MAADTPVVDTRRLVDWLETAGYRVAFRDDGWVECLVWQGTERWVGRGTDRGDALRDAARAMFPSAAARRLLEEAVRGTAGVGTVTGTRSVATVLPAAVPFQDDIAPASQDAPAPRDGDSALRPIPVAPTSAGHLERHGDSQEGPLGHAADASVAPDADDPARDAGAEAGADTRPDDGRAEPAAAAPVAEPTTQSTAEPPPAWDPEAAHVVRLELPPPLGADEAVGEVDLLAELIRSEQPELSLMTPERQRLVILAWICHARSFEAASGGHPWVTNRVAAIARQLTQLCKIWWPGSVSALQLEATPGAVGRELHLTVEERPRSWRAAAEAAEKRLQAVEMRDEADGKDEYGWADRGRLDPAPIDAAGSLQDVRNRLERLTGPLSQAPPKSVPDPVRAPGEEDLRRLLQWARRLRWLRGWSTDFSAWGETMGRLRWVAAQLERRDEELDELLSPEYAPKRSWATTLGKDPEAKRKRKLKKAVLQGRPWPKDQPAKEQLIRWLEEAFQVLEAERIAKLLAPFREAILALGVDDLTDADRRHRRRLRSVQRYLGAPPEADDPDDDDDDAPEMVAEADGEAREDPAEAILDAVRPQTHGLKAMFVSNRADPALETALRDAFEFASLDWCEGSPRRIHAVAERISAGSYDLVLGATGFQSHSMDTHLIRACRRANVRYVRVHRGRQLACTLALARELGVEAAA